MGETCKHYEECADNQNQKEQCETCYRCGYHASKTFTDKKELDLLKALCKELLDGADKCGQEPHYIVQPFLGIVKKYADIITKYELI